MKRMLFRYSLGHFAVDALCAWVILGRLTGQSDWVTLALVYNFCAFALQMPIGILADRLGRNRLCSGLGALVVCLSLLPAGPLPCAVLAGVGNAMYHVGGGREILRTFDGAGPLGVYVAPGAVGLLLGGVLRDWAWGGVAGVGLLGLCGLCLLLDAREEAPSAGPMARPGHGGWGRVASLFAVVVLRSLVGFLLAAPWRVGVWVWIGAVLAACGKASGGVLADRFGSGRAGFWSLLLAAALFLLPSSPVCGCLGGFFFQMSMPITLSRASRQLPGGEGFTFGLMTFGLFLGFLPVVLGWQIPVWSCGLLSALSAVALALEGRERAGCIM